jgi:hypothetical protein
MKKAPFKKMIVLVPLKNAWTQKKRSMCNKKWKKGNKEHKSGSSKDDVIAIN